MSVQSVKAVINGQTVNLTYNETSGKWEATVTAPAKSSYTLNGHYYPIELTATDDAGNNASVNATHETLGESLRLVVKEKVKPTITITAPTASEYCTNNKPAITVQLRDDDSGINIETLAISIDGGAAVGNGDTGVVCTTTTGGYNVSYTPQTALGDGAHTVRVNVSDFDGNVADEASVAFTVDTVPPVLSVTQPTEGYVTNVTDLTIKGVTNDATSSPVVVKITLNGSDQGAVTVGSDGAFTKDIVLASGTNTITVTATDSAGKESVVTRTVVLNTNPPVFEAVEIVPNPVDAGATYIIKVTVSDV